MKILLRVVFLLLFLGGSVYGSVRWVQAQDAKASQKAPAAGGGGGRGGAPTGPVKVVGLKVATEPLETTLSALGTLVANEAVEISSEQSLRLASVHFEEGQEVNAGDLLFQLDDTNLLAQLREVEARVELAQLTEGRLSQLIEAQAESAAAYDLAKSQVGILSAQADQIRLAIEKTRIRAPFSGRVGMRRVSVGAWVTPSDTLTTLQDHSRAKVDFRVPERYAPAVRAGGTFRFRPEGRPEAIEGRIVALEPAIEASTRSLVVRGVADHDDPSLIPGSFVQIDLPLRASRDAILIPTYAVVPSPAGDSVFVAEDGKAAVRGIEIGLRTPERVQVISGLSPGDIVITSNLLRLRPGVDVAVATD